MMTLYHSNRLENFVARLVDLMGEPLSDPLAPEVIVVQNPGMARWLSMRVAENLSVAANLEFPLPASFIWRVFEAQLPDTPAQSSFDKESLTWRCMNALPGWLDKPGFEPLQQYLKDETSDLKRYQLSRRIAEVYDQYLVYRPEWISTWENGEEDHWQAQLWRALVAGTERDHRAHLLSRFIAHCKQGPLTAKGLPERVYVFGIAALPPAYLEVLARISRVVDLHLFVLNPCLSYWGDIVEERDLARLRALGRRHGKPDAVEYYTVGNRLLASMGKLGRDFQEQLHQYDCRDEDLFALPEGGSLLSCIQSDILLLQDRGKPSGREVLKVEETDCSLQIHSGHSRMREVEIVHDQLLALFESDPDLRPQDVVVMTPDIDQYAPYIEAVFGTAPEARYIPWSIADRSVPAEHPIIQVFMQLLELPASRFAVSDVLSILQVPAVLRRFSLDEIGFERIRRWVRESGVRWGTDKALRRQLGLPAAHENTWRFGMERMLLGYAMPPEETLFHGILPYAEIEGGDARSLGRLQSFMQRLQATRRRLMQAYTPDEWLEVMNELLAVFFSVDGDEAYALQMIRDALDALAQHTASAGFEEVLGLDVVRDYLTAHLTELGTRHRFLTGQVTACNMVPMRSIPFKVVCLLGMNDKDYPRTRSPLGFDLMAKVPRLGDRSRREDDRYLFLEALLSARRYFYISYVGKHIRDNSELLPSVLVSELLEYIEQGYVGASGPIRQQLRVQHPLQPFSGQYFNHHPRIFSYAEEWLAGARAVAGERKAPLAFVAKPLPEPDAAPKEVDLDTLIRFFKNPAKFFMTERLRVWLEVKDETHQDVEPFSLNHLEAYHLKQKMLEQALAGQDLDAYYPVLRAQGFLPYGPFGEAEYNAHKQGIAAFVEDLAPQLANPLDALEVDLDLDGFVLRGWLHGVTSAGRISYRYTKVKPEDRLSLWIQHLALNAVAPAHCALQSTYWGEDMAFSLPAIEEAREHLKALMDSYWRGLFSPLAFFPKSAYSYAEQLAKGKSEEKALASARKAWEGSWKVPGEGENMYYQTAFRGADPLGPDFQTWAERILGPVCQLATKAE